MTENIIALSEQLKEVEEQVKSMSDRLKELMADFGQLGQVARSSLRNVSSGGREANEALRQVTNTLNRMSSPLTAIGAARTSAALSSLTGGGGGRVSTAGPSSGGSLGDKFADAIMSPLSYGLPGLIGASVTGVANAGGLAISSLGGLSGGRLGAVLNRLGGFINRSGSPLGKVAAGGSAMAIQAGLGMIRNAIGSYEATELGGRYLPFPEFNEMNEMGYSTPYGYTPQQGIALGQAINTAMGADQAKYGRMFMQASTRSSLRVDPSAFVGLGGLLTAGGQTSGISRIMGELNQQPGFVGQLGTSRQTLGYLAGIQSILGEQLAVTSKLEKRDIDKSYNLIHALAKTPGGGGLFDINVASQVAAGLVTTARSPGGGEAGQIAMLQAFGFGNPNMDALNREIQAMGGQGNYQRQSYLTARMMQEKALEEGGVERLLGQVRLMAGSNVQHQAFLLSSLSGGRLGLNTSFDIMSNADNITSQMQNKLNRAFKLTPEQEDTMLIGMPLTEQAMRLQDLLREFPVEQLVEIVKATNDLKESVGGLVAQEMPKLILAFKGFADTAGGIVELITATLQESVSAPLNP